jgi:hypothetical protein
VGFPIFPVLFLDTETPEHQNRVFFLLWYFNSTAKTNDPNLVVHQDPGKNIHGKTGSKDSQKNVQPSIHTEKELTSVNLIPLFFWERDNYTRIIPIYFENKIEKTLMVIPFYFADENSYRYILPIYFYNKSETSESTVFLPLHWSWQKPDSEGTLFLPFYLQRAYKDPEEPDKEINETWNLLGIGTEITQGVFRPSWNVDLGTKEDYYYIDTDISWLYYLFRLENRTSTKILESLPNPFAKKKESSEIENQSPENLGISASGQTRNGKKLATVTDSGPRVVRKKEFTREDSLSFYGVTALFGVVRYEAADTKRHVRLLPLAWFTFDTEADDAIYTGPLPLPFIWYSSPELS